MNENFEYDDACFLKKSTKLYKGIKSGDENSMTNTSWFTLSMNIAKSYANQYIKNNIPAEICEVILKKDVQLLNVCSNKFKMDFLDKINSVCFNSFNITREGRKKKLESLLPLGIPCYETQKFFDKNIKIESDNIDLEEIVAYSSFYGENRNSDKKRDRLMANELKYFYEKKCNGCIQPYDVETCYTRKGIFPQELILFNCDDCLESKKNLKKIKYEFQRAGMKKLADKNNIQVYPDNISQKEWNEEEIKMLKDWGYTGKIEIDKKTGKLKKIDFSKIKKNIEQNRFNNIESDNKKFLEKYELEDGSISSEALKTEDIYF